MSYLLLIFSDRTCNCWRGNPQIGAKDTVPILSISCFFFLLISINLKRILEAGDDACELRWFFDMPHFSASGHCSCGSFSYQFKCSRNWPHIYVLVHDECYFLFWTPYKQKIYKKLKKIYQWKKYIRKFRKLFETGWGRSKYKRLKKFNSIFFYWWSLAKKNLIWERKFKIRCSRTQLKFFKV